MKKQLFIILLCLVLIVAYIDLIDSCKRIDLTVSESVKSNNIDSVDKVSYFKLLKFLSD